MQIQVNTDRNVKGSEQLELHVRSTVEASLGCLDPILGTAPIHRLPGTLIRSWAFSRPVSPPHFAANSRGVR